MLAVSPWFSGWRCPGGNSVGAALRERGKERRGATAQATVVPPLRGPVPAANLLVAAGLVGAVVALWTPAAQRPGEPATTAVIGRNPPRSGPRTPPQRSSCRRRPRPTRSRVSCDRARTRRRGGRVLCGAQALAGHLVV